MHKSILGECIENLKWDRVGIILIVVHYGVSVDDQNRRGGFESFAQTEKYLTSDLLAM
jgi:hypothetical protein